MGWTIGLMFVAIPVWRVARDLDLRSTGVEAPVVRIEAPPPRSRQGPAAFVVGRDGAERRCAAEGVEVGDLVRFDPLDPARCRAVAHLGSPAPSEWLMLGGGLLVLALGVVARIRGGELASPAS